MASVDTDPSKRPLLRRVASVFAVVAAGFLSGWSSLGSIADGVGIGLALGAAVAVRIFHGESHTCFPGRSRL